MKESLTSVAFAEGRQTAAETHEEAAGGDGNLTTPSVSNVGREKETNDGPDVEHVDQDTELVFVSDLGEVVFPELDLLGSVDKHAVGLVSLGSSSSTRVRGAYPS